MLRSLFSGVSGMRNQQTKLDVIGNNIANVNTTAFKGARVTFKDMLNQTLQGASDSASGKGGINPKQVGLGVAIAAVDTNMNQGALQSTGRSTDLAIEGNGFFVISDGNETRYTRDGSFSIDKNGYLVTSEGYHVMGLTASNITASPPNLSSSAAITVPNPISSLDNIRIPLEASVDGVDSKLTSFSIDQDGKIKAIYGDKTVEVGIITLANFQNPAGLTKLGGNSYKESSNSGAAEFGTATSSGYGNIQQGLLEMSNVDLANEFTEMIITSRAFQANSRTITTSDEMLQELLNLKR
ncbi:flagellar basal-body rod protein FlgF [Caloramator sp. E03]|uniref:flagellar basal-body rod protein FlgF n=1 Tax=Caloramator sp. E03 TaxID=2576307 RepID=UPI001110270D|nr:flagellar basal-body rod protein FlgF [Caloramator sp. E03]QCX32346.1 flagellar basal-body rod protein FlgF [Caloramator sp. E03]